jgi:hypothetical protein
MRVTVELERSRAQRPRVGAVAVHLYSIGPRIQVPPQCVMKCSTTPVPPAELDAFSGKSGSPHVGHDVSSPLPIATYLSSASSAARNSPVTGPPEEQRIAIKRAQQRVSFPKLTDRSGVVERRCDRSVIRRLRAYPFDRLLSAGRFDELDELDAIARHGLRSI